MSRASERIRLLGRWENDLYDLMRGIEQRDHIVGCPDLHALVRLAWREATRTREAEEAREVEPATTKDGSGREGQLLAATARAEAEASKRPGCPCGHRDPDHEKQGPECLPANPSSTTRGGD